MVERYLHFEVETCQVSKKPSDVCGDLVSVLREPSATTITLCDGLGSGSFAYIAARMCLARVEELLGKGLSFHETFAGTIRLMEHWKQPNRPYTAFTMVQVLSDGMATILTYEAPPPVWVACKEAVILPGKTFISDNAIGRQTHCLLRPGESLLFFSDGITQAAAGSLYPSGWGADGVAEFISGRLHRERMSLREIPREVLRQASRLNNGSLGRDDMTAASVICRTGQTVTLLTGPPADRRLDRQIVENFMARPGRKIICGASTATLAGRELNTKVEIEKDPSSLIAPPRYFMEGIDLVTEGAVTLNQLNNVLDLDSSRFDEISGVTELYDLLMQADRVDILMGTSRNPANEDISFSQRGILSRQAILPIIADKLLHKGKHVRIEPV